MSLLWQSRGHHVLLLSIIHCEVRTVRDPNFIHKSRSCWTPTLLRPSSLCVRHRGSQKAPLSLEVHFSASTCQNQGQWVVEGPSSRKWAGRIAKRISTAPIFSSLCSYVSFIFLLQHFFSCFYPSCSLIIVFMALIRISHVAVRWIAHYREVPCSYLSPETGWPSQRFSWLASSLADRYGDRSEISPPPTTSFPVHYTNHPVICNHILTVLNNRK
jgi:hypothetical protein